LNAEQFGRLFGPAKAVLMRSATKNGLARATKPDDLPTVSTGPLTISLDQLHAMDKVSEAKYCAKMSEILRKMGPRETAAMTDEELRERVLRYEVSGNKMGLTQERSLSIWGYLMLKSGDRFESQPEIRGYLLSKPGTPDENVETLLNQMTRLAGSIQEVG
jgi:hypothetical protein